MAAGLVGLGGAKPLYARTFLLRYRAPLELFCTRYMLTGCQDGGCSSSRHLSGIWNSRTGDFGRMTSDAQASAGRSAAWRSAQSYVTCDRHRRSLGPHSELHAGRLGSTSRALPLPEQAGVDGHSDAARTAPHTLRAPLSASGRVASWSWQTPWDQDARRCAVALLNIRAP